MSGEAKLIGKQRKVSVSEMEEGDVFSEESHYIYEGWNGKTRQFKHLESGKTVNLDDNYVEDLLTTADQFHREEEVGKEDRHWTQKQIIEGNFKLGTIIPREGDLRQKGIRSIWADIHSSKVFTVCFTKQDKQLSNKELEKLRDERIQQALDAIDQAQKAKKGVRAAAEKTIRDIIVNPISSSMAGEDRILRGYKVQFESINGMYDVIDMDINEHRKVNVNNILWLVVDGVKYTVK